MECNATSYLDATKKCVSVVNSVTDCLAYSADKVCSKCANNKYFDSATSTCVTVNLTGCAYYLTPSTCYACSSGYFLTAAKICTAITATKSNCLVYSAVDACGTCATNYFVEAGACVKSDDANCAIPTSKTVCKTCKANFYLDSSSVCKAVTAITDCIEYSAIKTCTKCVMGKYPSSTKDSCVSYPNNSKCSSTTTLSSPVCGMCTLGYSLSGNSCTEVTLTGVSAGCAITNEAADACLACKSGYTHKDDGSCVVNSDISDTTTTTTTAGIGINAFSILSVVLVLINFLF